MNAVPREVSVETLNEGPVILASVGNEDIASGDDIEGFG